MQIENLEDLIDVITGSIHKLSNMLWSKFMSCNMFQILVTLFQNEIEPKIVLFCFWSFFDLFFLMVDFLKA